MMKEVLGMNHEEMSAVSYSLMQTHYPFFHRPWMSGTKES